MDLFGRIANPELLVTRPAGEMAIYKKTVCWHRAKKSLMISARGKIVTHGLASQNYEGGCICSDARILGAAIFSAVVGPDPTVQFLPR
jgi:hypothetical protein